jgi:PAS domain S-box-containing protein
MANERTSKAQLAELSAALEAERGLRRRAEQALRESQDRWRALARTALDSILIVDRRGTIKFLSRAAPGLAIDEVIGTSLFDHLQPESHRTIRDAFARVLRSGESVPAEIPGVGPEGTRARHPGRIGPVTRDGEVVGFIIVSGDAPTAGGRGVDARDGGVSWPAYSSTRPSPSTPRASTAAVSWSTEPGRVCAAVARGGDRARVGGRDSPPASRPPLQDQNPQVIDTGAPLVLEEEVETPDGRHLCTLTRSSSRAGCRRPHRGRGRHLVRHLGAEAGRGDARREDQPL